MYCRGDSRIAPPHDAVTGRVNRRRFLTFLASAPLAFRERAAQGSRPVVPEPVVPEIQGDFWTVAGNPDLASLGTPAQQPVDFAIWQAADSTWQLWSCIRSTRTPGHTRLFYRWQGGSLVQANWEPMGIALTADSGLGETEGGVQAPFVLKVASTYHMFYGDWDHICLATSDDGKRFRRQRMANGQTGMFAIAPGANTRDPMVLVHGRHYYCYTTANPQGRGAVYCCLSKDLRHWGPPTIVGAGGAAGSGPASAECPFVHFHPQRRLFYLFRTQRYGRDAQTRVYASPDPLNFGIDDDRYFVTTLPIAAPEIVADRGRLYLACLRPQLDGIRIAAFQFAHHSRTRM
jgi:hypothetical protein